jgi:uncharacterized glyoxalase superfamily protein PhnB
VARHAGAAQQLSSSAGFALLTEFSRLPDAFRDSVKAMKPRVTMLTLGVGDLERSVAFYRDGLGWTTPGIIGKEFPHGAVAFFDLQAGLKLALFSRENLAHDAGIVPSPPSATEFSLGYNVRKKEEVDAVMERARQAGATIVKPAQPTFYGGYGGYFADPDGHLWDVVFNPGFMTPE